MSMRYVLIVIVTVAWGCTGVLAGPSSRATTQSASRPTSRATTQPASKAWSFLDGGDKPLTLSDGGGTPGTMWAMVASVLVILVLGGVMLVVVKRLLPKLGISVGRRVRVLETTYLGPRKAVHLLQVGSQRFLVGSTRDRVAMLSEVTMAFLDEEDGGEGEGESEGTQRGGSGGRAGKGEWDEAGG